MNINKNSLNNLKTTDMLPHHDVVFRAPVCDPFYGLPIGNGSMGCLVWLTEEALHINVNHTDLIDDIADGDFYYKKEDETHTICRNGAEFVVDFGCPVFETIYQDFFEGRISLVDATAKIHTQTPFCKTDIRAFVSEKAKAAVISMELTREEEARLRCKLQRWGSRSFQYWYTRFASDTRIGLSGTEAGIFENGMYVSQKLDGVYFSVAVCAVAEGKFLAKRNGNHSVELEFEETRTQKVDFYIAVGLGETKEEAEKEAFLTVEGAKQNGTEIIYEEHKLSWEGFWNRSCVALSEEFDFIENLWYLNLYYGNSQMKGKYPPHFCNGIWGSFHDFVPWNLYFHYNTQHAMNSYNAANHPELLDTYFNFRKEQLDIAKKYANKIKRTDGAFYTDVCDMKGRMIVDERELANNCTCGAQIAMLMYRNYLYTGDQKFFEDTAFPVMKEIGRFYLDMLKLEEDGLYHIYDTTAYEGTPLFDDCITDLSMIRVLFAALIKELDEKESMPYKERLSKLVGFTGTEVDKDEIENGHFIFGIGKGNSYKGTKVLTVGRLSKGKETVFRTDSNINTASKKFDENKPVRKTFGTPEKYADSYYGFPDAECSPLYPAGLVGIKDKDSKLYNMIYNSICMHHPALEPGDDRVGTNGMCMGWCMMPIYLARMGMAEELFGQLRRTASTWIAFPQGFGLYGGYASPDGTGANTLRSTRDRWLKSKILNMDCEYKEEVVKFNRAFFADKPECYSSFPLWKFRHFNYETLPIIACAVNEMLVQSYDGVLRLFCAVKQKDAVSFKLAAQGGFIVSAVYDSGEFFSIIESQRGEVLHITFENIVNSVHFSDFVTGEILMAECKGKEYRIRTKPGMKICAYSENGTDINVFHDCKENADMKTLGNAKLGEVREF